MTSQQVADELRKGWTAASKGEFYDRTRGALWSEGFKLYVRAKPRSTIC